MSAVDDAYARYVRLVSILDHAEAVALRQPVSQQARDWGLVADTDRPEIARTKLTDAFGDMRLRIDYLGFLDLCASFEDTFRRRVATAVGEARKNIREHYNVPVLRALRERLVRDGRTFDLLASIFLVTEGLVPAQMYAELTTVREERNRVAHGTSLGQPLKVTVERTQELLSELIDAIW